MKQFEIGQVYKEAFIGNNDLYCYYKAVKRTACTVTFMEMDGAFVGRVFTCRICKGMSEYRGCEAVAVSNCNHLYANFQ